MSENRDIDLINDLIARPAETSWVEFKRNSAAQSTNVIKSTFDAGLIKVADPEHPRAGYVPIWA